MTKVTVSTITPVYRGEQYLEELIAALLHVKTQWEQADAPLHLVEAIFVNDSADDRSPTLLNALAERHPWIKIVTLSRNFGQHPATIAGILHCCGDWVVTLDEDLQHEPKHITALLRQAVARSADVIYAKPEQSVHQFGLRDQCSRVAKFLLAKITGNPHIRIFNSFRLVRGAIARAAASVCGHETYFDVALCWYTDRVGLLDLPLKDQRFIEHRQSGYSFAKLLSHARRLVVSSQTKVLRIGTLLGAIGLIASIAFAARAVLRRLFDPGFFEDPNLRGWPSLFVSILFFGGIVCFLLGIVLEYLTNMVLHTQGKPAFFVVDRSLDEVLKDYLESCPDSESADSTTS